MNGKSLVNMQISVEEVENMEGAVRRGYSGSGVDTELLTLNVLLSVEKLVEESRNFKIASITEKKTNGKIVINLQIAAEEIEDVDELSEEDIRGVEVMRARIPQ
jgi:hypothetical protein